MPLIPTPNHEVLKALIASVGLDPNVVLEWPEVTARPDGHFLEYRMADGPAAALHVTPAWVIEYRRALHDNHATPGPDKVIEALVAHFPERLEYIGTHNPGKPTAAPKFTAYCHTCRIQFPVFVLHGDHPDDRSPMPHLSELLTDHWRDVIGQKYGPNVTDNVSAEMAEQVRHAKAVNARLSIPIDVPDRDAAPMTRRARRTMERDGKTLRTHPEELVGRYAEAVTTDGDVRATGRVVSYSIGPVYVIETATGEHVSWREHLVREIAPDKPAPDHG